MTRRELYDYVRAQGCTQRPLSEGKAPVIYFDNPRTGREFWLNLPIDDRPVKDFTVYKMCLELGIPLPAHTSYLDGMQDKIDRALDN